MINETNFSSEAVETWKLCNNIFKMLKEKKHLKTGLLFPENVRVLAGT